MSNQNKEALHLVAILKMQTRNEVAQIMCLNFLELQAQPDLCSSSGKVQEVL